MHSVSVRWSFNYAAVIRPTIAVLLKTVHQRLITYIHLIIACQCKRLFVMQGRRDSYRGAVKDTVPAVKTKMGDSPAKKKDKKGEMEDLKQELTLDDHMIPWSEFHQRHEGSNTTTVSIFSILLVTQLIIHFTSLCLCTFTRQYIKHQLYNKQFARNLMQVFGD